MLSNLVLDISGEITGLRETSNENYESRELLSILNEESDLISKDTKEEIIDILKKIGHFGEISRINIDISFREGSILITGMAVIDFLGRIAGGISFFEYLSRLLRKILEKNIRSYTRRFSNELKVDIQVTPIVNPQREANDESSIFNISPSRLLLMITTINIIFFVGGTIFNLFQIDSLQKKYNEANEKYIEANKILASTKTEYLSKISEVDQIANTLNSKKNSILNAISSDTISISGEIALLNGKIVNFLSQAENLNQKIAISETALSRINDNIEKLQGKNIKFNFFDIWKYMTWDLRIILLLIPVVSILWFLMSIFRRR